VNQQQQQQQQQQQLFTPPLIISKPKDEDFGPSAYVRNVQIGIVEDFLSRDSMEKNNQKMKNRNWKKIPF